MTALDEAARPVWAEIDLSAIDRNLAVIRDGLAPGTKVLATVKADAYGHGMVPVARHLEALGVDGLATANVQDAIAARVAGVTLPILIYGAQLPDGNATLLDHGLTPTVYSAEAVASLRALAVGRAAPIAVHMKVDAGMGRLGVRLDGAAALARDIIATPGLFLEGVYTHIPFSDGPGETWSRRRLAAFAETVAAIEAEHGIDIPFAQAAASSVIAADLPDPLNTVSPGHLLYGLSPLKDRPPAALGLTPALRALRGRLIHIGDRHDGDDLMSPSDATRVGVILLGMDNGFRPAAEGRVGHVLHDGRAAPILSVSAEYTVIDLSDRPNVAVGDVVTVIGADGDATVSAEDVAMAQGAPSAAYWVIGLKRVPMRYDGE